MIVIPDYNAECRFPPVEVASEDGLLAVGGDLTVARLIEAYRNGIFPWYNEDQPILWWSPDPRSVLFLDDLKISRSLSKRLRNADFYVSVDTRFSDVVRACAGPRRHDANTDTWITDEMFVAYCRLHDSGYAHSVETWHQGQLVGGLYGVSLGNMFFGESMFSRMADASKVALACLVRALKNWDFRLIDCQLPSRHIFSLGAMEIPRTAFVKELQLSDTRTDQVGKWHLVNPCVQHDRGGDGLVKSDGELSIQLTPPRQ